MSRPRIILAIDCAILPSSVACVAYEGALAELRHDDGRRSDAWIGEAASHCLATAGRSPADIDGLAVSIGPGTFTGIRVGIATALGLAAPRRLPVAGVTTLEALAELGLQRADHVVACIDARRQQVYAAIYERHGQPDANPPAPSWGPTLCAPAELRAAMEAQEPASGASPKESGGPVLVLGSGAHVLDPHDGLEIDEGPAPIAAAIGRIALRGWPADRSEPLRWRPAEPLYIRPPDAKPPRNPLLPPTE